ncbi:putative S-phase kinase-associated protein [Dioscorea sansibarensis]
MGEQGKAMIKLQSSDGAEYELEEQTAAKFLFGDGVARIHEVRGGAMMIPRVKSNTLSKVVAYCNKHAEDVGPVVLRTWDDEFINVDDVDILYDLIMAAHNLGVTSLIDLCSRKVAEIVKGLTADEIRAKFNIQKDFTPEEEEAVRRENMWEF